MHCPYDLFQIKMVSYNLFYNPEYQFGHKIFFDFNFLFFEPFIIFGCRFAFEGVHKRRYTNVWGILTIPLGMFLPWTWCRNAQRLDTVQIPIFVDTCTNLLILLQTYWALNCFHSKNCCVWWQNVIGLELCWGISLAMVLYKLCQFPSYCIQLPYMILVKGNSAYYESLCYHFL